MKLAATVALCGVALAGTVRVLWPPSVASWVQTGVARGEREQAERMRVAWELGDHLLREVAREAGVRLLIWGPYRLEWGDEIRFARAVGDRNLVNATRVHDGWIFHAEGGLLYRSPTFAGALRPLSLPSGWCADDGFQPSHGRAVVTAAGAVFASDGAAFTRLDRSVPLRAAAFGGASWGLGLAHGGRVYETRDGGATWALVAGITERASALEGFDGGVRYFTDVWHVMHADGRTGAASRAAEPLSGDHRSVVEAFMRDRELALPRDAPRVYGLCHPLPPPPSSPFAVGVSVVAGTHRSRPLFEGGGWQRSVVATDQAVFGALRERRRGETREVLHWRMRGGATREVSFAADWMYHGDPPWAHFRVRAATPNGIFLAQSLGGLQFMGQAPGAQDFEVPRAAHDDIAGRREWSNEPGNLLITPVDDGFVAWGEAFPTDRSYREPSPPPRFTRHSIVRLPRYLAPAPRRLRRTALWHCVREGCSREVWFADPARDIIVGAARSGGRWGIVALEQVISQDGLRSRTEPASSTGFDAVAAALDGALRADAPLAVCSERGGASEIHALRGRRESSLGRVANREDNPRGHISGEPGHAVFALGPSGICLLRVEAAVDVPSHTTIWLDARDSALVGGMDDGSTVTELRGALTRAP